MRKEEGNHAIRLLVLIIVFFGNAYRIDVARIFSKEVEHSEGNAQDLKEMCMMEEIVKVDALCRQI